MIDDKNTKNAFVLPGGKIFVFTGILPVSANDDGLATVLGHEIAHQGKQMNFDSHAQAQEGQQLACRVPS